MKKNYRSTVGKSKRVSRRAKRTKETCDQPSTPTAGELSVDRHALMDMMQDSLHSFAVEVGLVLAGQLLEDEVTHLCGKRYERQTGRPAYRHGHQNGTITMAGQKLPISKPRARSSCGDGELTLDRYELMQREESMPSAALQRMVRGVSCRDYEGVVEQARKGFGVKRSSVSRHFVAATAHAVKNFSERRFDDDRFAARVVMRRYRI